MPPPLSKVWQFFTKKDTNTATCKKCFKDMKYSGNTTNLYKHLSSVHRTMVDKRNPKQSKNIEVQPPTTVMKTTDNDDVRPGTSRELDTNTNIIERETFEPLREAFGRISSQKSGGLKYNKITMALLYFICKDVRPFSIIEGEGFINLIKEVAPFYKVPSATFIKKKLMEKYEITAHLFKEKLTNAVDLCLTIDIWTETMAEKSFMGLTVHFFEGTNIYNRNIGVTELSSNHTASYIADRLQFILNNWNISIPKIRCVVSDSGANIVAGVKLIVGDGNHLPCFAHTINLVTEAILSDTEIKELIIKVRNIVKFIKNSVNNSDKLRKFQVENGIPEGSVKKMILDVSTRWNSVFYMIERFLEMIRIVTLILIDNANSPIMPNSQELEVLKQLILLLKPIEFVTKESSGENYITVSSIIPMLNCLVTQINAVRSDNNIINNIKAKLLNELSRRFGQIEFNKHVAIATLLDPRFKSLHFQNASACGTAVQKLKNIIKEPTSASTSNSSSESENEASEKKYDFWETHKQLAMGLKKKKKNKDGDEISLYLSSSVASLKSKPLEEWEEIKTVFPLLYKQARKFLVVVATSVPCERLFSKAGAIMTKNRNRLTSKHLDKLLFLGGATHEEFFG